MKGGADNRLYHKISSEEPALYKFVPPVVSYPIFFAVAFFLGLWFLDFPKPTCDDLFYVGAGLNLAGGGDLSNGLLARQNFPQHLFYIYPPVHSYALAGWLKIFGINNWAMTGFQCLMYIVTAISSIMILRRHKCPAWLEWAVPIAIAASLVTIGLRPETMATAFVMCGYALVETGGAKSLRLVPGFFLLSLGLATAPRVTFFGLGLMLLAVYEAYKNFGGNRRDFGIYVLQAVIGIVAAAFVFLLMIDFHLQEFWTAFHYYSQIVGGDRLAKIHLFFTRYIGVTQWPIIPFCVLLSLVAWRAPNSPLKRLGMVLALALVPLTLVGGLGNATLWYILLSVFAAAALVSQMPMANRTRLGLAAVTVAVLLAANLKMLVNIAGTLSGNITAKTSVNKERAAALRSTPEHPLLLDGDVARYVFDYRLPAHSLDWMFAAPFPAERATQTELRKEDVYLLGPSCTEMLVGLNLINRPDMPIWGAGKRRWALYRNPREVYTIPAGKIIEARNEGATANISVVKE